MVMTMVKQQNDYIIESQGHDFRPPPPPPDRPLPDRPARTRFAPDRRRVPDRPCQPEPPSELALWSQSQPPWSDSDWKEYDRWWGYDRGWGYDRAQPSYDRDWSWYEYGKGNQPSSSDNRQGMSEEADWGNGKGYYWGKNSDPWS